MIKHSRIIWNKDLTKETDGRILLYAEKLKGRIFSKSHKKNLSLSHKGKKPSKITKKKMHLAHLGKKNHFFNKHHTEKSKNLMRLHNWSKKGFLHPMYGNHFLPSSIRKMKISHKGKHFSEETKRKISLSKKGKKLAFKHIEHIRNPKTGNKNPNWMGGISFEPYGLEFNTFLKEQIRIRDSHSCQLCSSTQKDYKFHVHHIDYNKKNNKPENLITLCSECHILTRTNRNFWKKYLSNLIKKRIFYAKAV